MGKNFQAICIGDLHFGAVNTKQLMKELDDSFFTYLEEQEKINLITINGDLTDKALSYNEEASKGALWFVNKIAEYCKKHQTAFRIIRGTPTHERNQLENYEYLEYESHLNFRLILRENDEVINGYSILYLPEDYDIEFEKGEHYDFCFGHGNLSFAAHLIRQQTSERKLGNLDDCFNTKTLDKMIDKCCIFGHVHEHTSYKDKFYYIGSFTRWAFGEEKPKGFIHMKYIAKRDEIKVKFIPNDNAPLFESFDISDILNDESLDNEHKVKSVLKLYKIRSKQNGKIRFMMNLETDQHKYLLKLIREVLDKKDNVKVKVMDNSLQSLEKAEEDESSPEDQINLGKDIFESIINYAKAKYNYTFTKEELSDLLSSKI